MTVPTPNIKMLEAAPEPFDDEISLHSDSSSSELKDTITTTQRSNPSTASTRDEFFEVQKAIQDDTAKVNFWRTAATIILLQTAVSVTLITAQFLKDQETADFKKAFEQFSRTLADAALSQQENIRNGLNSIATDISWYASSNDAEWPFVTVPGFEHYAYNVRTQAKVEFVAFAPFVNESERLTYEQYSNEHAKEWVEEGHWLHTGSLERLEDPEQATYHPFLTKVDPATGDFVRDDDGSRDLHLPMWQWSPPPATYTLINYNTASVPWYNDLAKALTSLQYEMVAAPVAPIVSIPYQEEHDQHYHSHLEMPEGSSRQSPHTLFANPIQRNVSDPHSEVVGMAVVGAAWDVALAGVLPPDIVGIQAVVENSCSQAFTFEVNGEEAAYLGEGDLHDAEPQSLHERLAIEVDLALYTHPNFTETKGHCRYSMTLYPTESFRSLYSNRTPEIFAVVVAITFGAVGIVFLIYDRFVQARNRNLIATAAKSNAIVTDLFPEHMQGRLKDTQDIKPKGSLKSYLKDGDDKLGAGKPLADLFLETTVIFADIVGFTSWSSSREPAQVFELLQ